jgi:hypothetical protein
MAPLPLISLKTVPLMLPLSSWRDSRASTVNEIAACNEARVEDRLDRMFFSASRKEYIPPDSWVLLRSDADFIYITRLHRQRERQT